MSLRPIQGHVCWEIVDQHGEHTGEEGWCHYDSELKAHQDLVEMLREERESIGRGWGGPPRIWKVVPSFATPCLGLYCDDPTCLPDPCDMNDGGWTHLDPLDPLPFAVSDMDWLDDSDERVAKGEHYCPEHHPARPEDDVADVGRPMEGQTEIPWGTPA